MKLFTAQLILGAFLVLGFSSQAQAFCFSTGSSGNSSYYLCFEGGVVLSCWCNTVVSKCGCEDYQPPEPDITSAEAVGLALQSGSAQLLEVVKVTDPSGKIHTDKEAAQIFAKLIGLPPIPDKQLDVCEGKDCKPVGGTHVEQK